MSGKVKKRKDRDFKFHEVPSFKNRPKEGMSLPAKLSIGTFLSLIIVALAFFCKQYLTPVDPLTKLNETLLGLLETEESASVDPKPRVALGFGSCQDIIVQTKDVISDPPPDTPEHFFSISNKEEFLKVLAYFYRHGAAAERFISNFTFFHELVALAQKAPSAQYAIGGNAPVMAKRFAKEGCDVLLGAQISKNLGGQLPKKITVSSQDHEKDDIHLLLEYPAGQIWGPFVPPRANRFIVHNDFSNPHLASLDDFDKMLKTFDPDLVVIGGLQMMDNFPMPEEGLLERLNKVKNLMARQRDNVRIHFEMASYSDRKLLRNLVEHVIPFADSLGMNEQELPNLSQMLKYGNISLIAESRPRIAVILDEMRDVFEHLHAFRATSGARRLTRLHVHTLAFQAIMVDKYSAWTNAKAAAAKASLTATRHTCGSEVIDISKSKLLMDDAFTTSMKSDARRVPFSSDDPVSCWDEGNVKVCVAPVLVCTEVKQTGGGGDNISSAGLVLQI